MSLYNKLFSQLLFGIFSLHSTAENNQMDRIKEVLTEKGIKQTWLAEKLGKSFNMVNDYCNNKRQPSLEILFKVAELLNVDVKSLLQEKKDSAI